MTDFEILAYSWVAGILVGCVIVATQIVLATIRR